MGTHFLMIIFGAGIMSVIYGIYLAGFKVKDAKHQLLRAVLFLVIGLFFVLFTLYQLQN